MGESGAGRAVGGSFSFIYYPHFIHISIYPPLPPLPPGLIHNTMGDGSEVEDLPGAFHRPSTIDISVSSREYGPTGGIKPLRSAVAHLYNTHYRTGKASQYTWENVCIVPGGRAGLIRIAAVIGETLMAYFIPDYTAYNEMLGIFKNFVAVPVPLEEGGRYQIEPEEIRREVRRGVSVVLTSNPRNPTVSVIWGGKLDAGGG